GPGLILRARSNAILMSDLLKRLTGKCVLGLCDRHPGMKPLFRKLGLRTSMEWFGDRVVRIQLPDGRSFKLASLARNYLSFELFWRGTTYYEPITSLVMQQLLRPGDTFIDAGANVGFYSLLLTVGCPSLHVFAFEPNPKNYELLAANIAANGIGNITCEPVALSESKGTAVLYLSASDMSASLSSEFEANPVGSLEVPTTTLDQYFTGRKIHGRMLIKLDVEGHEPPILAGARRLIAGHRPDIVTEAIFQNGEDIAIFLKKLGYRFYHITDCGLMETTALVPFIRGRLVFLNCLLSTKLPGEVAELFERIKDQVERIDLTTTSKFMDERMIERLRAKMRPGRRAPLPAACPLVN
ncbi:MAG: FkbM family methyltransferase, partial [Verrucomicrobiota bacterium]